MVIYIECRPQSSIFFQNKAFEILFILLLYLPACEVFQVKRSESGCWWRAAKVDGWCLRQLFYSNNAVSSICMVYFCRRNTFHDWGCGGEKPKESTGTGSDSLCAFWFCSSTLLCWFLLRDRPVSEISDALIYTQFSESVELFHPPVKLKI